MDFSSIEASSVSESLPLFNLADSKESPRHLLSSDDRTAFRAQRSFHNATWAGTFHSYPSLTVRPWSLEEVQKTILLARQKHRRIVPVGIKHSPSDITSTSSWLVDLTHMNKVLSVQSIGKNGCARALVQAGISLEQFNDEMAKVGLTLPNVGSINVQSLSGAISTGTHGSSLRHGLLSNAIRGLRIVLADGRAQWCSANEKSDLFRAALLSLGALGIITEIEFELVPDRRIEWKQELVTMKNFVNLWSDNLWSQAEFVRCHWLPNIDRVLVWSADETSKPDSSPPASYYGGALGYYTYRSLLWLSQYAPWILPAVEWFIYGMQYHFTPGPVSSGVEPQRTGLTLDCLFTQFVNEWAIPLSRGPEAISRLHAWIQGDRETSRIPFSPKGIWVHSPIEIRVSDGRPSSSHTRAFLDPTVTSEPTLYINAIMYRPSGRPPPGHDTYYAAFEYLMRELGGRPHWAKNFSTVSAPYIQNMYRENIQKFLQVRATADPDGLFIGPWHRRNLLGPSDHDKESSSLTSSSDTNLETSNRLVTTTPPLPFEELEVSRHRNRKLGGMDWFGTQRLVPLPNSSLPDTSTSLAQTVLLPGTSSNTKEGEVTPSLSLKSEESFEVPPSHSSTEEIAMTESVVQAGES